MNLSRVTSANTKVFIGFSNGVWYYKSRPTETHLVRHDTPQTFHDALLACFPDYIDVSTLKMLSFGESYGLALYDDNRLQVWGSNTYGQLDKRTRSNGCYELALDGEYIVNVVAGSFHALAITKSGTVPIQVFGWGANHHFQLGQGKDAPTPDGLVHIPIPGEFIVSGACSNGTSAALTRDGNIYIWGRNEINQTGLEPCADKVATPTLLPMPEGDTTVKSITCGWGHFMCLMENGRVVVWGSNTLKELGMDTKDPRPQYHPSLENIQYVAAADQYSSALTKDGELLVWGANCLETDTQGPLPKKVFFGNTIPIISLIQLIGSVAVITLDGRMFIRQAGGEKTELLIWEEPDIVWALPREFSILLDSLLTKYTLLGSFLQ